MHYLISVYLDDETLESYNTSTDASDALDHILGQYGYRSGFSYEYASPETSPRFDYYQKAEHSRRCDHDYMDAIRAGEKVAFGIVAPEIGWFDKYDFCDHDYFGKYRELNEPNSQLLYEFEEKVLEFHQTLVANGYTPVVLDFHN